MANLHIAIAMANTASAHKEIVQWLAPIEYEAEYYTEDLELARKLRHPGTCEWIRLQPNFQSWSKSTAGSRESLLWIYAIPGAGKTVLSSFLIDHTAPFGFRPSSTVFYFLFKNTDVDKNSITAAARSLLYQLYKTRGSTDAALVDDITKHLQNSGQSRAKSFRSIWKIFCEHAANIASLVIVIDALDECIEPRFFIRGLQQLSKNTAIKIIVTSRREKELVEDLRDWMSIEMGSKEVAADIESFLEYKVSKSPKLSHPLVRSSVVKSLRSRSNGMFLWVALMIKDLKSKVSVYEIQDALQALPEGLDKMYERILRRLHTSLKPSPKELCLRVLRWIVIATRPLKIQELEEALKLEYTGATRLFGFDKALLYTERDIELACGSLLTVRSGTVQLIHLSARDFLQNPSIRLNLEDALHQYLIDVPAVNLQISSHCVSYLKSRCLPEDMLPVGNDRSPPYDIHRVRQSLPLLDYACFNWLKHLIRSTEKPTDEYADTIQPFFESQCCLIWISLCFSLDPSCSLRLHAELQELLDWAGSYSDSSRANMSTPSVLIRVAVEWAGTFQIFLTEYGGILSRRPSEVHFIDPERIFGPEGASVFRNSIPKVLYERHLSLRDPATYSERTPISTKYQLQKHTGKYDNLGFFYLDPHRDVFYMIDKEAGVNPRIFTQERSTGRRLPPLEDPELDYGNVLYSLKDACISPDGHHLAVTYCIDPSGRRQDEVFYTAVWAIAKKFDFTVEHRNSAWGKKLFSSTLDQNENDLFQNSFRFVVFAADGSLCCPTGRISFTTGEVQPLFPQLRQAKSGESYSYSGDGRSLFRFSSSRTQIEQFTLEGERLKSFTVPEHSEIRFISHGDFVIYSVENRLYSLDIHTGLMKLLDTPETVSMIITCSVRHFDADKLLGIVSYPHHDRIKTCIAVWTGVPAKPHLWAVKVLPTWLVGHFIDEKSWLLYALFPGRVWGRISLESSALPEKDLHIVDQIHLHSTRTERRIARNGMKLAEIKTMKLRCAKTQPRVFMNTNLTFLGTLF
jgi:hypothetical protein